MRTLTIDPGELRHELVLESATTTPDLYGGTTQAWATAATLFARMEPLNARQTVNTGQTVRTVTHRMTVRQDASIESGMRFRKGDRIFDILTVCDPDETGRYFFCETSEAGQ
ncbi:MAG TPA: phage head closure protein [Rhizobiaceae bacterium]|nr:phage head closure protein [Rhizobiaceae bacterium]